MLNPKKTAFETNVGYVNHVQLFQSFNNTRYNITIKIMLEMSYLKYMFQKEVPPPHIFCLIIPPCEDKQKLTVKQIRTK